MQGLAGEPWQYNLLVVDSVEFPPGCVGDHTGFLRSTDHSVIVNRKEHKLKVTMAEEYRGLLQFDHHHHHHHHHHRHRHVTVTVVVVVVVVVVIVIVVVIVVIIMHHQFNVNFLPRLIKGLGGCFPTAYIR